MAREVRLASRLAHNARNVLGLCGVHPAVRKLCNRIADNNLGSLGGRGARTEGGDVDVSTHLIPVSALTDRTQSRDTFGCARIRDNAVLAWR